MPDFCLPAHTESVSDEARRIEVPVEFCFRWLRETPRGMCRSPLPLRFDAGAPATALIKTTAGGGTRATVEHWMPPAPDPLLAALLGTHPLEWFRELILEPGSPERRGTYVFGGASPALLDALGSHWNRLGLAAESALWSALDGTEDSARAAAAHLPDELFDLARRMHHYARRLLDCETWPAWAWRRAREYFGQHVEAHFPAWLRLRDRIYTASAEALALALREHAGAPSLAVEIELPFRSRFDIRNSTGELDQTGVEVVSAGRVAVLPAGARRPARRMAERALQRVLSGDFAHRGRRWDTAADGVFTASWNLTAGQAALGAEAAAAHFGIVHVDWPDEPATARLTVEMPGALHAAWTRAPAPHHPDFGPVFGRVSAQLQTLLRVWLPALYFSDRRRAADPGWGHPILAFAATPPRLDDRHTAFTYDTTLSAHLGQARRGATAHLPAVLDRTGLALERQGWLEEAQHYSARRLRTALRTVRTSRGRYPALLRAEGLLIEQVLRVAAQVRDLRWTARSESTAAGLALAQACAAGADSFNRLLGDMVEYPGLEQIAPLLLMEATCALAGGTLRTHARVSLAIDAAGATHVLRPPTPFNPADIVEDVPPEMKQ